MAQEWQPLIGCARTSTVKQVAGLEAQQTALGATVCTKVFSEQESSVDQRDQLVAVLDYVCEGDALVLGGVADAEGFGEGGAIVGIYSCADPGAANRDIDRAGISNVAAESFEMCEHPIARRPFVGLMVPTQPRRMCRSAGSRMSSISSRPSFRSSAKLDSVGSIATAPAICAFMRSARWLLPVNLTQTRCNLKEGDLQLRRFLPSDASAGLGVERQRGGVRPAGHARPARPGDVRGRRPAPGQRHDPDGDLHRLRQRRVLGDGPAGHADDVQLALRPISGPVDDDQRLCPVRRCGHRPDQTN